MQKPREQSPWSPDITDQASSPSQPQKLPAGAAAHDIDIPTPPSTEDDQLEPTPNRIPSQHVRDVLRAIRLRQQGRKWASSSAWQRFSLTDSEYEQVQKILRDEEPDLNAYVQDKLRCDYFHSAQYLVLRMPSALHDIFIRFVAADIKEQLKAIAASASPSAEFAKDILDCSTTKIVPLDTNYKSHEPDASFKHVDAALPGVVLEVSYTQKRKDLPRLVDDYILGSDLNVQLVVGLDIEYRGKEAVLSMWRPGRQADAEDQEAEYGFAENFVVDQTFRDAAGQPCPEAPGLIIPLTSFAQPCLLAQFHEQNPNASPITENIDISAFQLLTYLHAAEEQDAKITQKKGLIERLPPQLKKRRRDSTPPEVLSAARDKRFCDDQARAEARLGALDSSFEGSAGSEEGGSFDNERVVLSQRKLRPRV